ncbi:MAG: hypothetical protein JWM59_3570 [Verrucomicrobiales bacterium]|nr:hypothetical protein [Verrucomicrobiales bacterium]
MRPPCPPGVNSPPWPAVGAGGGMAGVYLQQLWSTRPCQVGHLPREGSFGRGESRKSSHHYWFPYFIAGWFSRRSNRHSPRRKNPDVERSAARPACKGSGLQNFPQPHGRLRRIVRMVVVESHADLPGPCGETFYTLSDTLQLILRIQIVEPLGDGFAC